MNNVRLAYTLLGAGIVGLAWLLSGVREPINADAFLAYAAVVTTIGMVAVEYRIGLKRSASR